MTSLGFATATRAGAGGDTGAAKAALGFTITSSALIFRGVCAALLVLSDGILIFDYLYIPECLQLQGNDQPRICHHR